MSGKNAAPAQPDIAAGRLSASEYARNFDDIKPPLTPQQAPVEASRCYFCYDAPCIEACPTGIDIPSFIHKIGSDNIRGAALDILQANIFGGVCARVCPTEELCEEVCVRTAQEGKPVNIGLLQRYATDRFLEGGEQPFERAEPTGKSIAVIGAGPAGIGCAHGLARLGHEVTVYEARDKAGGLNEYGIAAYKVVDDFAQRELDFILAVGGITLELGRALGADLSLAGLRSDHDAVFLATGQAGVKALEIEGEVLEGVRPAIDYIAELRQAGDLATLPVGRKVIVIGGGNTAIDIAVQTRRLGAEDVTICYRRGPGEMGATWHEQEVAQNSGVKIKHWVRPVRLNGEKGHVRGIELEYTRLDDNGRLAGTGDTATLPADTVFTAIGQVLIADPLADGSSEPLEIHDGRIVVNEELQTSLSGVFAGGDCIAGLDLTVQAVEDGKIAARSIDRYLAG